ncbi:hypothetical protein [Oceanospirillum sediminis]|uniref:hypothetical protein n=1 Tax=Oceanospirillum sediminis TaxID=2760088 RepID=UPI002107A003|nr:hypothetical protein [Oceanospirillum sediminis]
MDSATPVQQPDRKSVIPRRKAQDDPCSFISLRREGIKYAQQFSGNQWTDYNLHDPGVTILEQVCYGLTDLSYRTDFSVADLLSDQEGQLDLKQAGLELPEAILPARPCTLADLVAVMLDQMEEAEQIWLEPLPPESAQALKLPPYMGLYSLELQLSDRHNQLCQTNPSYKQRIISKAMRIYSARRSLCEDIARIHILDNNSLQLDASIDLEGEREAHDVLADIYFNTSQWLKGETSSEPQILSYEQQQRSGKSLDEILTGPLTRFTPFTAEAHTRYQHTGSYLGPESQVTHLPEHGSPPAQHAPPRIVKSLATLYSILTGIPGVARIHHLQLLSDEGPAEVTSCTCLAMPECMEAVKVRLTRNGHPLAIRFTDLCIRIEQKQFRHQALRHTRQDVTALYSRPQGHWRSPGRYTSVQNHFPASYKLSVQGVPVAMEQGDKARLLQLRGYLLLFDQLMANYCVNLEGLRELFSVQIHHRQSYHYCILDEGSFRGIRQIYPKTPDEVFQAILANTDHYAERKGRLLDYLLALYGEHLDDAFFRRFNCYDTEQALENRLLEYKSEFIQRIASLTRDRAAGYDYLSDDGHKIPAEWIRNDNRRKRQSDYRRQMDKSGRYRDSDGFPAMPGESGFQQRIALLLGFRDSPNWPVTGAITQYLLNVVPDDEFRQHCTGKKTLLRLRDVYRKRLQDIPAVSLPIPSDVSRISRVLESIAAFKDKLIPESFLRQGIELERYQILSRNDRDDYQVFFRLGDGDDSRWLYIGRGHKKQQLIRFANLCCQLVIQLNRQSEGLYVVEHLLLREQTERPPSERPQPETPHSEISASEKSVSERSVPERSEPEQDHYSFRISVVLPGFTARCANPAFRTEAEQLIQYNCPAHIVPECHWLSFRALCRFESLYLNWLETRQESLWPDETCQQAADRLMHFLHSDPGVDDEVVI